MKKILKIIGWIFLSFLVFVIGITIYIGFASHDTTNNTPKSILENETSTEVFLQSKLTHVLEDAENKDDIDFTFDEFEMNQLLYCITKDLDIPFLTFHGAYTTYLDGNILSFELPANLLFFQTCLKGKINITFENQVLSFKIVEAKLGSMNGTSSLLLKTFVWNSSTEKKLENVLLDNGIYCDIDFHKFSATITTDEISQSIQNLLKDDPNVSLYAFLCDFCLNNDDTISFHFGDNHVYGITLHTSQIAYEETRDGKMHHNLDLNAAKSSTETRLSQGLNSENVSILMNYYIGGYNSLSDEDKETIDAMGLANNANGQKPTTASTMLSLLTNQSLSLPSLFLFEFPIVSIREEQADAIISSLNFVGLTFAFTDGEKVSAILLEELNINFYNDEMSINLIVNLNGKRIVAHIDSIVPETDVTSLNAEVTNLRLGDKYLSEKHAKQLLSYLEEVLKEETWISADSETNTISLDFKQTLSEIPAFQLLLTADKKLNTHCRRNTYGYIEIVLKPFS